MLVGDGASREDITAVLPAACKVAYIDYSRDHGSTGHVRFEGPDDCAAALAYFGAEGASVEVGGAVTFVVDVERFERF
mgnify:CR=1 FL=1